MITQYLIGFFHDGLYAAVSGLASLVPSAPTFWTDATTAISNWWTVVPDPMKYFLPIGPVIVLGLAYVTVQIALGVLAFVRRVLMAVIP